MESKSWQHPCVSEMLLFLNSFAKILLLDLSCRKTKNSRRRNLSLPVCARILWLSEGSMIRRKSLRELAPPGLPSGPAIDASTVPVTDADLAPLPEPVRRYLQFMDVVGRPRDWSFRLAFTGLPTPLFPVQRGSPEWQTN